MPPLYIPQYPLGFRASTAAVVRARYAISDLMCWIEQRLRHLTLDEQAVGARSDCDRLSEQFGVAKRALVVEAKPCALRIDPALTSRAPDRKAASPPHRGTGLVPQTAGVGTLPSRHSTALRITYVRADDRNAGGQTRSS